MTTTKEMRVTAWANGLREIADWAEGHPLMMERALGLTVSVFTVIGLDDKEASALFAKELPRPVIKAYSDNLARVGSQFGPHQVEFVALRENVCARRVIGTKTITVDEPDPEMVAALPTRTVTREVEIVEWDCGDSLLETGGD